MFRRVFSLSGIAILGVVISHSISHGFWALYAWTDRYQNLLPINFDPYEDPFHTPQWYVLTFGKLFFNFCVPAFFFVSGFFLSYAIDKRSGNVPWKTIKSRILGLLPSFFIWTIIYLAFDAVIGTEKRVIDYILPFLGVGGFWFIPAIIIFYLLARWIIVLARKNWKILLLCTGLLQISMTVVKYLWFGNITIPLIKLILYDNFEFLIVNNIFYFTFGIVFGMNMVSIKDWLTRQRIPILISFVVLLIYGSYVSGTTRAYVISTSPWNGLWVHLISSFTHLTFILAFLAYDTVKIPFSNWFTRVGTKTYGIYLTHIFFISLFAKMIYHYFPLLLSYQLLFTALCAFFGVAGPLLLMNLLRRLPDKRIYAILFG